MNHKDTWTVVDGHYVGHDGFVCPATFGEFYERYPDYFTTLAYKFSYNLDPAALQDLTQTMLVSFMEKKTVEKFDPAKVYGANSHRWFSYVTLCAKREVHSTWTKGTRNPLNLTSGDDMSCVLMGVDFSPRMENKLFIREFKQYIMQQGKNPEELLLVMDAIQKTKNISDAARFVGMSRQNLSNRVKTLKRLAVGFTK